MLVNCEFCGEEMDPKALGNYRKVIGWTENRKQGGTNSITMPSEPLGYAHNACIDYAKLKGAARDQESFFG